MNRFRESHLIFFCLESISRVCLDSRLERAEASQLEPLWLALPPLLHLKMLFVSACLL